MNTCIDRCRLGSGSSNQWTLLFDGDVNLSAVMSFVSIASSFFMMPLYFYTFGRIYMDELSIHVPFLVLLRSLALVVIPYSLGIAISHWSPKLRSRVEPLVKPMMLFILIFFLVLGTIVNWYMIQMIDLYIALTAPLLPYLGFIGGALLAWLCRLEWTYVKTIGIEAGIQNTGIAFMIMLYSFPPTYAMKAIVVPLVVSFLTSKPFWLVYVVRNRVNNYRKRKEFNNETSPPIVIHIDEQTCANKEQSPISIGNEHDQRKSRKDDTIEMMQNL
jgi:predicted Na+-dependent transporter